MRKARLKQSGLVTVLFTVASALLLGFIGLAVDTGFAYGNFRQAQIAADAGAISGAFEMYHGHDSDKIELYAKYETKAHGFEDTVDDVTVQVNSPPTLGAYSGNSGFVEVVITKDAPTFFLKVLGFDDISYSVRAVANGTLSSSACVYALGNDYEKAFHVSSGSTLSANCGAHANSTDGSGLYVDSGSTLEATSVDVVGGAYSSGSTIDPSANEGAATIVDPLSLLAPPAVTHGNCDFTGNSKGGGLYERYEIDSQTRTIYPGSYCGGIFIKGSAKVTMSPGTYILQGGGLVVDGSDAELTGDGVFIYNTCAKKSCADYGSSYSEEEFHPLDVKSSGTLNLSSCSQSSSSACSSGVDTLYEDIFWYTDRDAPSTSEPQQDPVNKLNSSASADLAGIFYAGNQYLEISSNTDVRATNSVFITKFIQVASDSSLNITHNGSAPSGFGSGPYERITLVE